MMLTKRILSGAITSIFCFVQVANASNGVQSQLTAYTIGSQLQSLQTEEGLAQTEANLDIAIQKNQNDEDGSAAPQASSPVHNARWARVKSRWSKRLQKRASKQVEAFNDAMENENVDSFHARVNQEIKIANDQNQTQKAQELGTFAATTSENFKQVASQKFAANLSQVADKTATAIADHGGIVPFLVQVKGAIHQLKLSMKTKKDGRSPASIWNDGLSTTVEILLVLLILGIFGAGGYIGFAIVGDLVGVGITFGALMIDTVIISVTHVGAR